MTAEHLGVYRDLLVVGARFVRSEIESIEVIVKAGEKPLRKFDYISRQGAGKVDA